MKAFLITIGLWSLGCGGSSDTQGGGVGSCVTQTTCASSIHDCPSGQRCNGALSPPVCQALYCGGVGSACGGDSADDLCSTHACVQAQCTTFSGTVSCQSDQVSCIDYTGLTPDQIAALRQSCAATLISAPCSHASAVGGCRKTTGPLTTTVWSYAPYSTAADVSSACMSSGDVFVTP